LLLGITPQAVFPDGATEPERRPDPAASGRWQPPQPLDRHARQLSGEWTEAGAVYANKPVLAAQEIEDLVAYLMTLRAEERRLC